MNNIIALTRAYTEPHRHYHTLNHIANMFSTATENDIVLSTAEVLAIWWHDYVYDPKAKNNEARSAYKLFEMHLVDGSTDHMSIEVRNDLITAHAIILDTINHKASSTDSELVLDLDLCGLGSSWNEYTHNTALIRNEYSYLTDIEWLQGRLNWISTFKKRPYIFHTDWAYAAFEQQAQMNLQVEYDKCVDTLRSIIL